MASEATPSFKTIAHEADVLMSYWLTAHSGSKNNCELAHPQSASSST